MITSRSARPPSASSEPMPARTDAAYMSSPRRSGSNTEFPVPAVAAPRHQPHEGLLFVGKEWISENHARTEMPRHWPDSLAGGP